ncbi:MAG: 50S ribosomal protein L25/general stress protein Ctc [Candidatus Dactylopiibacterium carminicum]|uniref:Large ribosomal subunit protein bL25 n=1 Tax=Candidatus Dactylopiibacterium carminicum TaxID=857335 RepID=A0A272EQ14_9RHOO|nr:50S ribosomal protein L25/general stress protein Ctc [Candidatus Dactylopiibacterium carminicum]KAF7598455.1 50S ribosomal protein L25/general stress protein Ctc [Candidatus Dactylopiibacterium carminicum]PAS92215.1 MAG: 50S ribosomal protein L25/general stress protein Ctc [Candidatus Dactylopiibacterium carminicum]PAS95730.1 MAG: 50S ribosomal protein L25/general stress protein Ctc [Candidatus Dactylopiibacterium carminicum]PAS97775.1 MAG: 50S ribosomal protein L25/general stress protein Ct
MQFNIQAAKRDAKGKGASRRLRRVGTTPGIIYGGDKAPVQISLDHNDLFHILRKEAFHSSLISIDVEGSKETVLLRDVQWHPFRQLVLHIDFQRVDANQVTHVKLPLHFVNAELAPGVKTSGGVFSHLINEVDVKGLPGDMPAFIEVDVKALEIGASLHLRDVQLPKGLELAHSTDADKVIASIVSIRGGAAAAAEGEGEGEAQPAA